MDDGNGPSLFARTIDGALECTVIASYGRPGIRLRRRVLDWPALPSMEGRRVLITGATSGIGRAAATRMARLGATVGIIGRDLHRTRQAAAALPVASGGPEAAYFVADLASLAETRAVAEQILADGRGWDVLVHNAGSLTHEHRVTDEGFETTYATQVLSPHVLTSRLLPLLADGVDPRVVVVSSGGMYLERLDPQRVQMSVAEYAGARAYARAKRAQVTLTEQWAARAPGPVTFHSMHPGWADTPGVRESLPGFRRLMRGVLRSPDEGADTVVWLSAHARLPAASGSFWLDRRPRGTVRLPGTGTDAATAAALWDQVCRDSDERPAGLA